MTWARRAGASLVETQGKDMPGRGTRTVLKDREGGGRGRPLARPPGPVSLLPLRDGTPRGEPDGQLHFSQENR